MVTASLYADGVVPLPTAVLDGGRGGDEFAGGNGGGCSEHGSVAEPPRRLPPAPIASVTAPVLSHDGHSGEGSNGAGGRGGGDCDSGSSGGGGSGGGGLSLIHI